MKTTTQLWRDKNIKDFNSQHFDPQIGFSHFDDEHTSMLLALREFMSCQSQFITELNQAYSIYQVDALPNVKETIVRLAQGLSEKARNIGAITFHLKMKELMTCCQQEQLTQAFIDEIDQTLIETVNLIERFLALMCIEQTHAPTHDVVAADREQLCDKVLGMLEKQNESAFEAILKLYIYNINVQQEHLLDSALHAIEKGEFTKASSHIESVKQSFKSN